MSASSSSNDLRNRIIFSIAILTVYRFGTFVPLPGIDPEQLKIMMEGNQKGLLGMFNVFAGGAISRTRNTVGQNTGVDIPLVVSERIDASRLSIQKGVRMPMMYS